MPPPPPPPPPHQPPHQPPPPPHQPPQYQYYPYQRPKPTSKSSCTKFCSCILATTFLTILALVTGITLFILFHPKDPTISISAIKFPSFARHNSTASFTISQFASVHNPNRFSFSHHSSSFHLFSSISGPIGFIYIPAGFIPGGSTKFVSANFVVQDFDVGPGPTLEVETKMVFVGSVMVLKVFSHRVQKSERCRVSVRVTDGFLLGYHC